MASTSLSWTLVDSIGDELGVTKPARAKWRQRGVPPSWQIKIAEHLMSSGVPIALADFRALETTQDRIAA